MWASCKQCTLEVLWVWVSGLDAYPGLQNLSELAPGHDLDRVLYLEPIAKLRTSLKGIEDCEPKVGVTAVLFPAVVIGRLTGSAILIPECSGRLSRPTWRSITLYLSQSLENVASMIAQNNEAVEWSAM